MRLAVFEPHHLTSMNLVDHQVEEMSQYDLGEVAKEYAINCIYGATLLEDGGTPLFICGGVEAREGSGWDYIVFAFFAKESARHMVAIRNLSLTLFAAHRGRSVTNVVGPKGKRFAEMLGFTQIDDSEYYMRSS